MSSAKKALLAVAAVVVLDVAFALVQPGDDDDDTPTTAANAVTTTETPATVEAPPAEEDTTATATATAPAAPPQPDERDDRIRFTVSSDQSDEVHVHGYDLGRPVAPGAPARFSFNADADGIFEIELHGSGAQIASLEVQPG